MNIDADAVMEALGHRTRRAIVQRLAAGGLSVGELAQGLPVGRPAVSMHLRVLRNVGLVQSVGDGNRRVYRLDLPGLDALQHYLDWYWSQALVAFQHAVENRREEGS